MRRCWASAIPGNGGFGQTAAEFRPLRFQNHADFGAQGLRHKAQHAQGMPLISSTSWMKEDTTNQTKFVTLFPDKL
jgi:hypothetical protein